MEYFLDQNLADPEWREPGHIVGPIEARKLASPGDAGSVRPPTRIDFKATKRQKGII